MSTTNTSPNSTDFYKSPENEAQARNQILHLEVGKVPSYGLWYERDISQETLETRIAWFEESQHNPNENIKKMSRQWSQSIRDQAKLLEVTSMTKSTTTTEYCSKRFASDWACDI